MQTTETVHLVRAAFEWSFCLKSCSFLKNVRLKCEVDSQIRFTISSHQLRASCDFSRMGLNSHSPKFSKCAVRHVPWTPALSPDLSILYVTSSRGVISRKECSNICVIPYQGYRTGYLRRDEPHHKNSPYLKSSYSQISKTSSTVC